MEQGLCPRCASPYRPADLVGFGILRPRRAEQGGPLLEYACPSCQLVLRFIPYGEARYALPGQPPPPEVPLEERRPPWVAAPRPQPAPAAPATESEPEPRTEPAPEREVGASPEPEPEPEPTQSVGLAEALALLGVPATASLEQLQRAFRERSLTCHPDKVAHLDVEIQEAARLKFLRLRAALDLLAGT